MAGLQDLSDAELIDVARARGVLPPPTPLSDLSDDELRSLAVKQGLLPKIGVVKSALLGAADGVTFNTTDELGARTLGILAGLKRSQEQNPTPPAGGSTLASASMWMNNWRAILAGAKNAPANPNATLFNDAGGKAISDLAPGVEEKALQDIRTDQKRAREERPLTYYGSGVAASLATPPGIGAAKTVVNAATVAKSLKSPAALKALVSIAKAAGQGATMGAAYGAAATFGDAEGGMQERTEAALDPASIATNATLGAGGALALSGAAKAAGKGWRAMRARMAPKDPVNVTGSAKLELPDFDTLGEDLAGKARAAAAADADVKGGEFFDALDIPATRGQRMGDTDQQRFERLALEGNFGEDAARAVRPVFEDQARAFSDRVRAIGRVDGEMDAANELEAAALLQAGVKDEAQRGTLEAGEAYEKFWKLKTKLPKNEPGRLAPKIEQALEDAGIIDSWPAQQRAKGVDAPERIDLEHHYSDTYRALEHIRAVTKRMELDDNFRTLQRLEPTRQVINDLLNKAAKNEDSADLRGLTILKREFDDWAYKAFERAGKMSAKGARELPVMFEARAAHARVEGFKSDPALNHILTDPKANEASVLERLFGGGVLNAKSGSIPAIRAIKEAAARRTFPEANGGYRLEDLNARELAGHNESWRALRAAALQRLLKIGDGKYLTDDLVEARGIAAIQWQRMHDNLNTALNSHGWPITRELFTPEEVQVLQNLMKVSARLTTKRGTQNASGTSVAQGAMARAWMQRLADGLQKTRITFAAEIGGYTRDRLAAQMAKKAAAAPTGKVEYGPSDRLYDLATGLKSLLAPPADFEPAMSFAGGQTARIAASDHDDDRRERANR